MLSFKNKLVVILIALVASIHPQECEWTRKISSANSVNFQKITSDKSGNIYLAGARGGKLILQNTESEIILGKPDSETFIIKYNKFGEIDLILRDYLPKFNNGPKIIKDLMVDPTGNIVLIGYERLGSYNYDKNGFLIKLDPKDGSVIWTNQLGFGVIPNDLEIDGESNIYITGVFLNNQDSKKQKYETFGESDIMIAKFSKSGEQLWSKILGGESYDSGKKILVNSDNQIIVTGLFTTTAYFDNKVLESSILGDEGQDIFIALFSANGECYSVNSLGSQGGNEFFDAIIDSYDNLSIRGYTPLALRFNSEKIKHPEISNWQFLLTFDKNMNVVNKKIFSRIDNPGYLKNLQVDSIGNIFYLYEHKLIKEWYYKSKVETRDYNILIRKQYDTDKGKAISRLVDLAHLEIIGNGNLLIFGSIKDDTDFLGCNISKRGKSDYFVSKIKLPNDDKMKEDNLWYNRPIGFPVFDREDLYNRIYARYGTTIRGLQMKNSITLRVYISKEGKVNKVEGGAAYGFTKKLVKIIKEELIKTKFVPYVHKDGYPKNAICDISLTFNF